jgi:hypothetical protein
MSGHVFVSHGSDDSEEANGLAAMIEARGVKVWIAPRDVRPGQDYSEQLQSAIEQCAAFVVLVTAKANSSPYVRAETEMAFSTSKPIFPVRMADIQPAAGLAFFLKIRHWTDAFGPQRAASLERLLGELVSIAGPSSASVAAPISTPVPPAPPPTPPPPPVTVPAPVAAQSRTPVPADTALLEAAIGSNAAYFIEHWRKMDETGRSYDWNWAACFLNFCWFAYRKMWIVAGLVGFSYVVTTPCLDPTNRAVFRLTALSVVAISFLTGGFGNRWYRAQVEARVQATTGMSRESALAHLRKGGGTSGTGVAVAIIAILLLSLIVSLPKAAQQESPQANAILSTPENAQVPYDEGKPPPPPEDQSEQDAPSGY